MVYSELNFTEFTNFTIEKWIVFFTGPFDWVVHPARKMICHLAPSQKISHPDKSSDLVMVFPLEHPARIWGQTTESC
jgi:hypothetical protein